MAHGGRRGASRFFFSVVALVALLVFGRRRQGPDCRPWKLQRQKAPRWSWWLLGVGFALAGVTLWKAAATLPDALETQFAGNAAAMSESVPSVAALRTHLRWDVLFLLASAFGLLGFAQAVVSPMRVPAVVTATGDQAEYSSLRRPWNVVGQWGWIAAIWPLGADLIENGLLCLASKGHYELAPWVQLVASVKWLGYAVLVAALCGATVRRIWSPESPPPTNSKGCEPERNGHVGIACSGGGIRSATFCLGGLQALGERCVRGASHLSGVSGGAYIAAAMTNVARNEHTRLPFANDSDELKVLRARSSYLLLSGREGRIGVFRAVASFVFNLVVLWLVVFLVGRPLGWIMTTELLHPELRARTPVVRSAELTEDVETGLEGGNLNIRDGSFVDCPESTDIGRQFLVNVGVPPTVEVKYAENVRIREPMTVAAATRVRDGAVRVCGNDVAVTAHPAVEVDQFGWSKGTRGQGEKGPPILELARPMKLGVRSSATVVAGAACSPQDVQCPTLVEQLRLVLTVEQQPAFTHNTGAAGRENIDIDGWLWGITSGLLVVALLMAVLRPGSTLNLRWAGIPLAGAALIGGMTIVVPWLLQSLPGLAERAVRALPGTAPTGGTGGGLLVWLSTLGAAGEAARRLTSGPPGKKRDRSGTSRLRTKTLVLVLLCVIGGAVAFRVLQQATLNGPVGRIGGLDVYWRAPPEAFLGQLPDLARWGIVVAVLVLLNYALPAHRWSLMPLYRDRLAQAFQLAEGRGKVEPKPKELTRFTDCPPGGNGWPELIVCAAANLNDTDPENRLGAGRWADSFTFSPKFVGGPTVGYVRTADYENGLSKARARDVSLASVVSVSGAAFSPAMGKFDYGPIGGLFAVLNLRLGLWLPQPRWVAANPETWRRKAGWPYLLSELFGAYKRANPFVYTTDGGHWENIGVVELLRRGCTEIYVLSAAGDGATSFSTLGEAIALAREELDVDIHVDLSPLRPRIVPADQGPKSEGGATKGRQLLRKRDGELCPEEFAPSAGAVGWFTYPAKHSSRRGRILFVEANLVSNTPWDVQSWAESQNIFPDDPTTDQFFNHRQFESYRRLGMHQVEEAQNCDDWRLAGQWVEGKVSESKLKRRLLRQGLS